MNLPTLATTAPSNVRKPSPILTSGKRRCAASLIPLSTRTTVTGPCVENGPLVPSLVPTCTAPGRSESTPRAPTVKVIAADVT